MWLVHDGATAGPRPGRPFQRSVYEATIQCFSSLFFIPTPPHYILSHTHRNTGAHTWHITVHLKKSLQLLFFPGYTCSCGPPRQVSVHGAPLRAVGTVHTNDLRSKTERNTVRLGKPAPHQTHSASRAHLGVPVARNTEGLT